MFERKQVAKFIVLVLVIYILLAVPWPGVRQAYSAAYRVTADWVLGVSTPHFLIYVRPLREDEGDGDADVKLGVWDRQVQSGQRVLLSTRLTGYLPTAEILALVLATSLPWSRKWKALLWGAHRSPRVHRPAPGQRSALCVEHGQAHRVLRVYAIGE